MAKPEPLADRLWRRVVIGGANDCWPWTGFRSRKGYGQIAVGGVANGTTSTHRAAWMLTHGPIPPGAVVRHDCDNPPCCNPAHLQLGTPADNTRDMIERKRIAREFHLSHTRLSDADVAYIRRNYWRRGCYSNSRELAARFGVRREHICAIVRGDRRKLAIADLESVEAAS